jgi:acetyl-CoA C-acetyltransferase
VVADTTPVIIGVGQVSERPQDADYAALSPMDLGGQALAAAITDCQATTGVAAEIDTIAAIRQFEISTPVAAAPFGRSNNPPRSIAARVDANPARAILEITGGQAPQALVGELAGEIAAGRSHVAAIVGAEAISTALALTARGDTPDWSEEVAGDLEDRGYGLDGLLDVGLTRHGVTGMIPAYALFENVRRARLGQSLDEYRQDIGNLFAPFSAVAAANPHAANRTAFSAVELAQISDRNRIVAEPYGRLTVSRDQVNQGAAILIASVDAARRMGVPEHRWVHIHAVASEAEPSPLARMHLGKSAAAIRATSVALATASGTLADIAYLDLYSCFAIAVFNLTDALALPTDGSRALTLTGGLPFFGGAGNNYATHAIAEAVARCRAAPGSRALVGANGGAMGKYAAGIYGTQRANWQNKQRLWRLPTDANVVPVVDSAEGMATIETYTMIPNAKGARAPLVLRTPHGARLAALADLTHGPTAALIDGGMPFGAPVTISTDERGRMAARLT